MKSEPSGVPKRIQYIAVMVERKIEAHGTGIPLRVAPDVLADEVSRMSSLFIDTLSLHTDDLEKIAPNLYCTWAGGQTLFKESRSDGLWSAEECKRAMLTESSDTLLLMYRMQMTKLLDGLRTNSHVSSTLSMNVADLEPESGAVILWLNNKWTLIPTGAGRSRLVDAIVAEKVNHTASTLKVLFASSASTVNLDAKKPTYLIRRLSKHPEELRIGKTA